MDIEFHYYQTHLIALRAGFSPDDALTIAYASQYTDDNENVYRIEGHSAQYTNLISQTMDITKPQEERLSIYPLFHFCPGTKDEVFKHSPARRDGKFHLLATIPDNKNAKAIFERAVKSNNLYRIGIGAHMYADTFCHCDFAGWKDEFNWTRTDGVVGEIWSAVGPAIGHALAMHCPDIPSLVWEDVRLTSKYRQKRNKEKVLNAAGKVFDFFCLNTKPSNSTALKQMLIGDLDAAIGEEAERDSEESLNVRMANYKVLLGTNYKEYKKADWFSDAIRWQVEPHTVGTSDVRYDYSWRDDHLNSDWFRFQEAVKAHHAAALEVLADTFAMMETTLA